MIKKFLLIACCGISLALSASDLKYPVSAIPKELLKDAKAVVRKNDLALEIFNSKSAVMRATYVITILNKNGISGSILQQGYNKFIGIKKISATVYDQSGKIVHNSNTQVIDLAPLSAYSLYDDIRVKILDPKYAITPFTVEYSFEVSFDGLLSFPDWVPYEDYNTSVEKSTFSVTTPKDFQYRYLEKNLQSPCDWYVTDKNYYKWIATNLPALKKEPYSQSIEEYTPAVFLAPNDFEFGGIKGNSESWKNFGLWIKELGEKKDILPDETAQKIKAMVENAGSDLEKIRILYQFMQDKVRYVSLQIGIGGWQPIDAGTVDRVSYGDCKALSNYMKSLLRAAGINSNYAIINAGEDAPPVTEEFPSNRFNHAILCVPADNDTIWLECTSQQIPFGFLGKFTDDRKALIITENGGVLVNTNKYSVFDNTQERSSTINLASNGDAEATVRTKFRGLKYDEIYKVLLMDDSDRKEFINEKTGIHNAELISFNYKEDKSVIPSLTEDLRFYMTNYGSVLGSNLIFKPNLISRLTEIPVRSAIRNSPIVIKRSFSESDTLTYLMQGFYSPESKPANISIGSPFGEYKNEFIFDGHKLIYIRTFKLNEGTFSRDKYDSFVEFLDKVRTEDDRKYIFSRI
jgi:hypothetical protein